MSESRRDHPGGTQGYFSDERCLERKRRTDRKVKRKRERGVTEAREERVPRVVRKQWTGETGTGTRTGVPGLGESYYRQKTGPPRVSDDSSVCVFFYGSPVSRVRRTQSTGILPPKTDPIWDTQACGRRGDPGVSPRVWDGAGVESLESR